MLNLCVSSPIVFFLPQSVPSGLAGGKRGWIPVYIRLCNRRHQVNFHSASTWRSEHLTSDKYNAGHWKAWGQSGKVCNYWLHNTLISITVKYIASTISSSFKINLISQYFIRFYFHYFTRSGHVNLLKALRSSMEYESRNVSLKYCGKEVWRIFLDDKFLSPFN